jgi:DNA-binding SARP family transcriptional activator
MGEPTAPDLGLDVGWVLAAASAALLAGQFGRARRLLHADYLDCLGVEDRGRIVQMRARLTLLSGDTVTDPYAALAAELDAVAEVAPALAARMHVDAGVLALWMGEFGTGLAHADRAVALADGCGDPATLEVTALMSAVGRLMTGDVDAAVVSNAYRNVLADQSLAETMHLLQIVIVALGAREQYHECVKLCADVVSHAREVGGLGPLPIALCLLSNLAWYAGEWRTASLAAAEALQVSELVDQPTTLVYAHVCLALVAATRGREAECHRHIATARELSAATGVHAFDTTMHLAAGSLALGSGDYATAADELAELIHGVPTIMWPFLPDHAEVLIRGGRVNEAMEVLAGAEQFAAAAGNRWAAGGALRCRALLCAPEEADALIEQALALQDSPFERARSQLCWAERLLERSQCQQAREQVTAAVTAFRELDAAAWAQRAEALLAQLPVIQVIVLDALVRIRVLGDFAVEQSGRPVPIQHGVPTQALKVVVVSDGRIALDALADALWPGEPAGRARLRTVLTRVRSLYGDVLQREGDEIRLAPGVAVDAQEFTAHAVVALRDGDLEAARRALRLYAGELLPVDRYHDWTAAPRERLQRRYLDVLDQVAQHTPDPANAAALLERACECDRYDDRRLVRTAALWAQAGRHGRAAELLRRAKLVAAELGAPPPPEFDELLATGLAAAD